MQQAAAGGRLQADKSASPPSPEAPGRTSGKVPGAIPAGAIIVAGALLTAGVVAAILAPGRIGSITAPPSARTGTAGSTLSVVAPGEIAYAIVTLDPASAQQKAADAKSCKAPIAWVTLMKQGAGPDGTIRIRSGNYLSPPFRVTNAPQRVAIPYPAPYATGHGVLSVVGEANGLSLYINPVWHIQTLNGTASLNVNWATTNPC